MSEAPFEYGPRTWIPEPPGTEQVREKLGANGPDKPDDAPDDGIVFTKLDPIGPANIAPRQWAYGRFMLFGSADVIGAVDFAGKGTIAATMICEAMTGRSVLREKVWRKGPVAIVTYEDDTTEWHRRLAAACLAHGFDYEYVINNVLFVHCPGGRVAFAQRARTGDVLFPHSAAIIRGLKAKGCVWLIVDPFNSAHDTGDGNNNVLIARVADELSRIAREANVAVLVLHHLRKGSTGDLDDLMGATALRANFRSCRILARMTADQAKAIGIAAQERFRYLCIASAASNYAAPPAQTATWFKIESKPLGNARGIYPEDDMGVATRFDPPALFEGLSLDVLERIFNRLRGEVSPGRFYSPAPNSTDWAGDVIIEEAGKTKPQATAVLKTWKDNKVVSRGEYWSEGNKTARIVLNEAKIAEILAPLRSFAGGPE